MTIEQNLPQVRVGIGIIIVKDGKILMGKRRGSHGAGHYALPGGHMEYMESIEDSARREIREETGLEVGTIRFLTLINLKEYAPKHYLDIGLVAEWKGGEPRIMEPDKIEGWNWYDMEKLPSPLFATIERYVESYKTGKNFWDN